MQRHVLSRFNPHLLAVVRDAAILAGAHRALMKSFHVDVLQSGDAAQTYLLRNQVVTHVLCEDVLAEDVHRFLTETLRSPVHFLVLGGASLSLAGRGVRSTPKPPDADRILVDFKRLEEAYADAA